MSIPILGGKKSGVADLRPVEQRQPKDTGEWINHPSNAGMKKFILLFRKTLRAQEREEEGEAFKTEDVLASYLAGFLSGMTLIQGVFIGSQGFIMAQEIMDVLPEEDPEDAPATPAEEPSKEMEQASE